MNRIFSLFAAFWLTFPLVTAQTVSIDTSFSEDGIVRPISFPSAMYCHPLDIHPNGNIIMGGYGIGPNGLKVTIFSPEGDSINVIRKHLSKGASALRVDPQGRLVFNYGSTELWRCLADGTHDSTFGDNGIAPMPDVMIRELDFSAEGKIYGAGEHLGSSGVAVVAFTPDGIPDSTFSDDGVLDFETELADLILFYCMKVQADGKILVSGFTSLTNNDRPAITIRVNPDGTMDNTFANEGILLDYLTGSSEGYSLAIQSDQKILVGGYTYPSYMGSVVRYLPTGQRDPEFGTNGVVYLPKTNEVLDIIVRPDGKILLFVWVPLDPSVTGSALFQLLPNGALDLDFGAGGKFVSPFQPAEPPMDMAAIGNNKIVGLTSRTNSATHLMSLQQFILDFNVGVLHPENTLSKADVLIYPNPVQETIQLQFTLSKAEKLDIQILDLTGKVVQTVHQQQHFTAGQHEVPIRISDALPAGTYVLCIAGDGKNMVSVQWVKG